MPTNGDRAVPFLAHDHPRLKGDRRCRFVLVFNGMNCTPPPARRAWEVERDGA